MRVCAGPLLAYQQLCSIDPASLRTKARRRWKRRLTRLCCEALLNSGGFYWLHCSRAATYPSQLSRHWQLYCRTSLHYPGDPEEGYDVNTGDSFARRSVSQPVKCVLLQSWAHIQAHTQMLCAHIPATRNRWTPGLIVRRNWLTSSANKHQTVSITSVHPSPHGNPLALIMNLTLQLGLVSLAYRRLYEAPITLTLQCRRFRS